MDVLDVSWKYRYLAEGCHQVRFFRRVIYWGGGLHPGAISPLYGVKWMFWMFVGSMDTWRLVRY